MKNQVNGNIFFLFLLLIISGCTSQPVKNLNDVSIPILNNGETPSLEKVERAILAASKKRGWIPRIISPGLIEATITIRSHKAVIEIPYTNKSYSILYKDSSNLDYENGKIHRNYNRWIVNLSVSIQGELGLRTQNH